MSDASFFRSSVSIVFLLRDSASDTGVLTHDCTKFSHFEKLPSPDTRIRADANNLWRGYSDTVEYMRVLDAVTWAIEEPFANMAMISRDINQRIILDESSLRQQQFDYLDDASPWIINVRVSKTGGLIRAKAIAEEAGKHNIPLIVGAQVRETSVLTRAGLTIANAYSDNVLA